MTQLERLTSLEVQVAQLRSEQQEVIKKLDDLLAMRNKGVGAFWLASTILGTGIVGFALQLIAWWKHG